MSHIFLYSKCGEIFEECLWNGKVFPCCQEFHWLYTTNGSCLTFNSEQTIGGTRFKASSIGESKGLLDVIMKSEAHVFVHDPKEINMNEDQGLFVMRSYSVIIFIKNLATVIADESAKELKFNKRNCVLPGELDDKMSYYLMYSRSACEIECEFYKQMNKCNCSKHTLLKTNDNGINCTNDIQSAYCYSSMDQKRTENCFCPPTCEINEFRVVWHQFKRLNKKKSIQIKVETLSPQTERIIMRPRFTRFEIFVGLACFTRIITSKSFLWFGYYLLRIIFIKRNDEKSKNNIAYQYSSCLI